MVTKGIKFVIVLLFICTVTYSQNITNTLGANGNYIIKSAISTFLTLASSNGCIGIGTNTFDATNPEKLLIDCGTTTSVNAVYAKGSINSYFQFNIQNSSTGNYASSDVVMTANNGTETTNYMDIGINNSGYVQHPGNPIETGGANDCYMLASGNDLYIVNNNPTKDMLFLVGGTDTTKQRMRIRSNGNVSIGYSAAVSYKLGVNGSIYATSYWQPSDINLKHDIQTLSGTLDNIMKMRGVSFKYNNDESGKNQIGFIAQEMEKIYPEFVTTGEDGVKGVSYANITAVLLEGIKEQQGTITILNGKVADLETRISNLEQKTIHSNTQPAGMNSNILMWVMISFVGVGLVIVILRKR
jgi:hypothetical protein